MAAKIALGLRIKTGFAIAVVVEASAAGCGALRRELVALSTPTVPDSQQPYHPALDLPEKEGAAVTKTAVDAVRKTAQQEMAQLLAGFPQLRRAGLVVGSLIPPDKVANPHIRAHALEGKLFREVVAEALQDRKIEVSYLLERDAYENAATKLEATPAALRRQVDALGRGTINPWRAEEKLAALAAYCLLHDRRPSKGKGEARPN